MRIEFRKVAEDKYDTDIVYTFEGNNIDEILDHVRRFLFAAGFILAENEWIEQVDYDKPEVWG